MSTSTKIYLEGETLEDTLERVNELKRLVSEAKKIIADLELLEYEIKYKTKLNWSILQDKFPKTKEKRCSLVLDDEPHIAVHSTDSDGDDNMNDFLKFLRGMF